MFAKTSSNTAWPRLKIVAVGHDMSVANKTGMAAAATAAVLRVFLTVRSAVDFLPLLTPIVSSKTATAFLMLPYFSPCYCTTVRTQQIHRTLLVTDFPFISATAEGSSKP